MLVYLLILAIAVAVTALLYARWEYRRRGKLTLIGLLLLCIMLFIPNLMVHFTMAYGLPSTPLDFFGVVLSLAGLVLCLVGITHFRSIPKMLCMDTGELTISGPYRWSRNPQYVGWLLFLLGFTLNDWSPWCLAALMVVAISLHFLVLIEEEHLYRVFGERYASFRRKTPRYAGWGGPGPSRKTGQDEK